MSVRVWTWEGVCLGNVCECDADLARFNAGEEYGEEYGEDYLGCWYALIKLQIRIFGMHFEHVHFIIIIVRMRLRMMIITAAAAAAAAAATATTTTTTMAMLTC